MGNDPLTTKLKKPYQDKKKPENQENHQKSEHENLLGVISGGGCTSLGREGPGEVLDGEVLPQEDGEEEEEGLQPQLLALVRGRLQDLGALEGDEDLLYL